jgi:hypothetical protein
MFANLLVLLAASAFCAPTIPESEIEISDTTLAAAESPIIPEVVTIIDVLATQNVKEEVTILGNPAPCDVNAAACPIPDEPTSCVVIPKGRKSCLRR